ncbi:MAG: Crp/Fnr family transcriptional regulator [Breznakia sp.]
MEFSTIWESKLFNSLTQNEKKMFQNQIQNYIKIFKKGSYIYREGDILSAFGIVISGHVSILNYDFWGNTNIIGKLSSSQLFAEAFCAANVSFIPLSVMASEDSEIALLPFSLLFDEAVFPKELTHKFLKNMMYILATKNVYLQQSVDIISKQKTSEKVIRYLSYESKRNHSNRFEIPYNRNELADYLGVDRSALSTCLSKLKKAGILKYKKSHFTLNDKF